MVAWLQTNIIILLFCTCLYFRFDVEISDGIQATRKEILEKIPGKYAIFCTPTAKIDEEFIKAAGKKRQ